MRPGKTQKISRLLFIGIVFLFIGCGLAISGDIFLAFIGEKIHIKLDYKNHSGFISCFLLRFIELEGPFFTLKDFGVRVGCERAFVEPRFDELPQKGKIILNCALENASLNGFLTKFFFENIYTELVIYGETVEFTSFEAHGKDAKLYASGFITESGDLAVKMKAFFSPEIIEGLSEELKALLVEESKGWHSYYLDLEQKEGASSLKLESDLFKLDFERVESK